MSIPQREERRQQEERRNADCQKRKRGGFCKINAECFKALPAHKMICHENQEHENAGKKSDVVVCKQRKRKRYNIQSETVFGQQLNDSKRDQRSDAHRIKPDRVPVISHKERAEREAAAENKQSSVVALEHALEEVRHKAARKRDFDTNREHKEFAQIIGGNKYREKVERTRQIVRHQREVVSSAAHSPGPEQRIAVL